MKLLSKTTVFYDMIDSKAEAQTMYLSPWIIIIQYVLS